MEEVFEAIVKACPTYTLPSPWQNIPCDPAFVRLPADASSLLMELRDQFSEEDLITAGVAIGSAEGKLEWDPDLISDVAPIWAIRPKATKSVTKFIAQMRTFGQETWAVEAAFHDHRQDNLIDAAEGQIVVAYSMADLAILRSVGIAAIPGENWNPLKKAQLDFLCTELGITSRTPTIGEKIKSPRRQDSAILLLANWSLAAWDRADLAGATSSWAHLVDLSKYLGLTFESFGLWKPSQKYLTGLDFQLRYLKVPQIRSGLLKSMANDLTPIDADLGPKQSLPQSIVDAHRAWQQAERDTRNQVGRQRAFQHLSDLMDRQLFDPLREEALRSTNPMECNALIALAESSRLFQFEMLRLSEKVRSNIGEKGMRAGSGIPKEELAQALALSDRIMALMREVYACRRNQPAQMVKPH